MKKIVGIKPMNRQQIKEYVRQRINYGIRSAAPFMRDMLKRTVGVQAPRRRAPNTVCGWVATTKAKESAPPRRVSGCGQAGIYYNFTKNGVSFRSRRRYMQILEYRSWRPHPWIKPTLQRFAGEFMRIVGQAMNERRQGFDYAKPD